MIAMPPSQVRINLSAQPVYLFVENEWIITNQLTENDLNSFKRLVYENVSIHYAETERSYAEYIVKSHEKKRDIFGCVSLHKTIWVLRHLTQQSIYPARGFTVVTEKRGGAIKFGPTVLVPEYQGKGLASQMKAEIEKFYSQQGGFRRAYSTVCDNGIAFRSFTHGRNKYHVEFKLKQHYGTDRDEAVLYKMLQAGENNIFDVEQVEQKMLLSYANRFGSTNTQTSVLSGNDQTSNKHFKEFLLDAIYPAYENEYYGGFDEEYADAIIQASCAENTPIDAEFYLRRRRFVYLRRNSEKILTVIIATPKRGGAVHLGPFLLAGETAEGVKILTDVETRLQNLGRRKLFAIIPELDIQLRAILLNRNFVCEGILHEPYHPGINMQLFSKMLNEVCDGSQKVFPSVG